MIVFSLIYFVSSGRGIDICSLWLAVISPISDELSPDNCRLWDIETNECMDKDRFNHGLGKVEEAYQEVARRLGIFPEGGPIDIKGSELLQ